MDTISVIAGVLLIALVLRDVFDTLFHPHGKSIVGERIAALVWRAFRAGARARRSRLSLAGPTALVTVISTWGVGVVVGGALVIGPSMPEGFSLATGRQPLSGFGDALYLSFVNVTSLGYGDAVPDNQWLQLFSPAQSAIGLGLVSASIAWVVSVYRVLKTSRSVAREIDLLASSSAQVEPLELGSVGSQLVVLDIELRQFPIAYYFPSLDRHRDVSLALGRLFDLVESPPLDGTPQARRAEAAADGLLAAVNDRFLGSRGTTEEEILALWQRDQLWS